MKSNPSEIRRQRMLEAFNLRRNPDPNAVLRSENARKTKREWTMSERAQSRRKLAVTGCFEKAVRGSLNL